MKTIRFSFDFLSPYAWLAARKLKALARDEGCTFEYAPVLLAGLLQANGTKGPAEVPTKRDFVFRDILRSCQLEGFSPKFPPSHPFNPLNALRIVTAVEQSQRGALVDCLFDMAWNQGKDISDVEVLEDCAKSMHLPWDTLQSAMRSEPVKLALRQETEGAAKRGLFGVPSFEYENELYWGHDRLPHLAARLKGQLKLNPQHVAELLGRPVGAKRANL